jgi:hypothetical protein
MLVQEMAPTKGVTKAEAKRMEATKEATMVDLTAQAIK